MKSVLISIQPRWCELIASGKKTVEVRKTRPKLEPPFKCYIYETQGRTETPWMDEEGHLIFRGRGMVIGEFVCNHIECFTTDYRRNEEQTKRISRQSCVCLVELMEYEGGSYCLYGWHISDLVIYDEPKKLADFRHTGEHITKVMNSVTHWECGIDDEIAAKIRRPPQSWCYVEEAGEQAE